MPSAISFLNTKAAVPSTNPAGEGAAHGPPFMFPVTGGWLGSEGSSINWWQNGYSINPFSAQSAIVEACVSAYSQTVAMCPGDHWLKNGKNGRDRVTTSALSRVLRQPNDYQSTSDFLLNAVRHLYLDGNAYALCIRNARYEIDELHLMDPRMSWPQIAEDGSIFYQLGGNWIIENRLAAAGEYLEYWPARDVMHIRLHTDLQRYGYPLVGQSPLMAAIPDIIAGDAIKQQQYRFFMNSAKPSFILSTDLLLEKDQVQALRERWDEQTKGAGAGGTPILNGGIKPYPISTTSRDAQLAELLNLTNQDVALAFRIPLAMLGLGRAPHGSTDILMREWIATGLGFCLNHVEEAFDRVFGLYGQPDEYVEFSTEALLRSAFKDRISALKDGVQGGIFTPNEARNQEGLDSKPFGDEPRVQQQVVPLSAAEAIPAGPPGKPIPQASPPAPPAPPQPGGDAPKKELTDEQRAAVARELFRRAERLRLSA